MNRDYSYRMEDMSGRPLLLFTNAIKSDHTRKTYMFYLRKFLRWSKINNVNDLIKRPEPELQTLLEDYLFYLKETISPNSLNPQFAALELFFSINDKILNFKKIRKMFPAKVKKSGRDHWTTEQIAEMLKNAHNLRTQALIHFLASTGCRIGTVPELKLRHVKDYKENCKIVTFYEGTNEEYLGFLTPEASKELDSYLRKRRMDGEFMTENSPLFRSSYMVGSAKARPVSYGALQNVMKRVITYVNREKVGNRYNIQSDQGFRKRFDTILKSNDNANPSLVERLMGHSGVFELDGSYFRPNADVLFSEFRKHILNLTVDDSERQRIMLQQKEFKIKELEEKNGTTINEIKQKIESYDLLMKNITEAVDSIRKATGNPNLFKSLELGHVSNKIRPEKVDLGRVGDDLPF